MKLKGMRIFVQAQAHLYQSLKNVSVLIITLENDEKLTFDKKYD